MDKLFFPEDFTCELCGIEVFGERLCADCKKTITFNDKALCPVCGRKNVIPEICAECKAQPPKFVKAASPLVYEGGAVTLIHRYKNGNGHLREYFSELIIKKLEELPAFDSIAYVPMTERTRRRRGYNQSEELAKCVSEKINAPLAQGAIIKVSETPEQKSLTRAERAENLKKCFKVENREAVKGKKILVIDDVMTTGATADAISERLYGAGAAGVYFASVASVEYKRKKQEKIN